MYGKKVKLRFFFVVLIFFTLVLTVFLVLKSLEENVVYFKSPSDVKLIKELSEWFIYDLPKNLLGKIWKGKYPNE